MLDEKQQKSKNWNLLPELRAMERNKNTGSFSKPKWSLKK
jgi:hypothetical protein